MIKTKLYNKTPCNAVQLNDPKTLNIFVPETKWLVNVSK